MVLLRRILIGALLALGVNFSSLLHILVANGGFSPPSGAKIFSALLLLGVFIFANIHPCPKTAPTAALRAIESGCELLRLFLISVFITAALQIYTAVIFFSALPPIRETGYTVFALWGLGLLCAIVGESLIFWNGMLRVYFTSVQLGIKHRVLAAICGWIPFLNIWYLGKIISICSREVLEESSKIEITAMRADALPCKTKYPIVLVHGVFFRDFRYLDYWGRIPGELQKNGAVVYYGQQQSAASVEACGEELARRIRYIVDKSGCGKVNIIAHSKGGLDCRCAISQFGAAPLVASLTTINTPHRGCIFAEYLLNKIPDKVRQRIANTYNAALKKLGDSTPDFLGAVGDLTESACLSRNESLPDDPDVLYESVMSYCRRAKSGKFPLNISYPLVRHFDGQNDGLVSVTSARWGSRFTLVEPTGRRGISHGDMIDLNRENIPHFDVREFYVSLVSNLKNRGY